MFASTTYRERRRRLKESLGSGKVLLAGNTASPVNFPAHHYPFRQDSTFLYYFGISRPGLVALMDIDADREVVFGDDPGEDEWIWTVPPPPLAEATGHCEVKEVRKRDSLARRLGTVDRLHFPPPYRAEHRDLLERELGLVDPIPSSELVRAVVAQRSCKEPGEIREIESALEISHAMHAAAFRAARPGRMEAEVLAQVEGEVIARGSRTSFPTILSVRGEILHNPYYGNRLEAGALVVHDSGAESPEGYAGDITRTLPVSGRFDTRQRDLYSVVLQAQEAAIQNARPGVLFRDLHALAARELMAGMGALGLVGGDPEEAVAAGAHTLFFPCGLGHMMGLDVHDMEALGEDLVGYTESIRRNPAFGWKSLRLARALEPGFVITIEPGIYFHPGLIHQWHRENRLPEFIRYDRLNAFLDFGGIRVEDDFVIEPAGACLLGPPIPKSFEEIESAMAEEPGRHRP